MSADAAGVRSMTTPATSAADKVALVTGGARHRRGDRRRPACDRRQGGGARSGRLLATCPEGVLKVQADIARAEDCEMAVARVRANMAVSTS